MISYDPAKLTTALQRAGIPLDTFRAFREPCWLAGGAVRDLLLGREPVDFDLVTPVHSLELARHVARLTGGGFFLLDEERRYYRVVSGPLTVDITPLRDATIQGDLLRRDISINAIAIDLARPDHLVDPAKGESDLRSGMVRHLLPDTFRDDPGRLVKALRHATEFGFELAGETLALIREEAPLAAGVAPERSGEEIRKICRSPHASRGLRLLRDTGLLGRILPDIRLQESALTLLEAQEGAISSSSLLAADPEPCATDLRLATALGGNSPDLIPAILDRSLRYGRQRARTIAAILRLPALLPEWIAPDRRTLLWLNRLCGPVEGVIPALPVRYPARVDGRGAQRLLELVPGVVEQGRVKHLLAAPRLLELTGLSPGLSLGLLLAHLLEREIEGLIATPEEAANYLNEMSEKGIDFANPHSYTAPRSDMRE